MKRAIDFKNITNDFIKDAYNVQKRTLVVDDSVEVWAYDSQHNLIPCKKFIFPYESNIKRPTESIQKLKKKKFVYSRHGKILALNSLYAEIYSEEIVYDIPKKSSSLQNIAFFLSRVALEYYN
jgi:hypothetical protein